MPELPEDTLIGLPAPADDQPTDAAIDPVVSPAPWHETENTEEPADG